MTPKKTAVDEARALHDRVSAIFQQVFGSCFDFVQVTDKQYEVHIKSDSEVTFQMLEKVSRLFGTKNINFKHATGWGGSEVTPGDPDSRWIAIERVEAVAH